MCMTEALKSEYTSKQLDAIIAAYHAIKRSSMFGWSAIHPEFGVLETEVSEEAVKVKLKTLYRKSIRKACMVITTGEIRRVFDTRRNAYLKERPVKTQVDATLLTSGSISNLPPINAEFPVIPQLDWNASPYRQPPFSPMRPKSPRDMIIDGAGNFRSFGGK